MNHIGSVRLTRQDGVGLRRQSRIPNLEKPAVDVRDRGNEVGVHLNVMERRLGSDSGYDCKKLLLQG